ncbi:hypothetical protein ACXYTJ_14060 [Gilvimarinus sp. F26214L]|uniref:hypothetical protein n=1 Tax=Gilvimarinus sp. DZF01 TaxID=3461371 RepID=UPI0040464C77
MKVQLQEEITKLERQLLELHLRDDPAEMSRVISCREMIHARREMLRRLPR